MFIFIYIIKCSLSSGIYWVLLELVKSNTIVIIFVLLLFQTLGNHEFDHGIGALLSYLNGIQDIPTVVSNLNLTAEPELNNFVLPSLVLTINNTKVGIVGCLTTDTPVIILHLFTSDTVIQCIQ